MVRRIKAHKRFEIFIALCLPLLILSCGGADSGSSESEAQVRYRTGVAFEESGRLEEAIASYDEALRLEPQHVAAYAIYNNRGRSYAELGRFQLALNDLNESIRLFPRYGVAFLNRARAYSGLGQYEKAIQDYDEAARLNHQLFRFEPVPTDPLHTIQRMNAIMPTNSSPSALFERGRAYAELGRYEEAIGDYNEVLRSYPQSTILYAYRALAFTHQGRDKEAQQDVDRAVALGIQREDLGIEIYIAKRDQE